MVKLSHRLMASASFVSHGSRVADIGCDHAYISIYLIQKHIADFCIAMDIKEGPLARAKENIRKYGCEKKIETRISDGLRELWKGEVDTILISGMGGMLIQKILAESASVVKTTKELILQPQSDQESVRRFLHEIGFEIRDEVMLKEDGKYYISIHAVKSEKIPISYKNKIEYLFGKILLEKKDKYLLEYLQSRQQKYEEISERMKQYGRKEEDEDYKKIREKLFYIKQGQEQYSL